MIEFEGGQELGDQIPNEKELEQKLRDYVVARMNDGTGTTYEWNGKDLIKIIDNQTK